MRLSRCSHATAAMRKPPRGSRRAHKPPGSRSRSGRKGVQHGSTEYRDPGLRCPVFGSELRVMAADNAARRGGDATLQEAPRHPWTKQAKPAAAGVGVYHLANPLRVLLPVRPSHTVRCNRQKPYSSAPSAALNLALMFWKAIHAVIAVISSSLKCCLSDAISRSPTDAQRSVIASAY